MAKKSGGPVVDFTGVEAGGGRPRVPEDDYLATVKSVKQETSKNGNEMLVWDFELQSSVKKANGKVLRTHTVLTKESLWKLKQLLEAMGKKVPSASVQLNLRSYLGEEVGVTVIDDEYNNKIYSTISDFVSPDSLDGGDDDEDEDDEEETPKAKKSNKKAAEDDDDEDEDIEDIDLDEI